MSIMPGVNVRLIGRHNSGPRRPKGRGTSFHVTASAAASMFGYFSTVADCSHFHVAKDGTIEQYIDTDFYGAAQVDGNDMVSVETQGAAPGVNAETEPWTPQQVTSNARIARWVHDVEGAPLVLMPDSRPGSRGVASHRLGIAPWRVAGGQVWSRVNGKVCPGSAKIAQLPQIIALAISGDTAAAQEDEDMNADQVKLLQATKNAVDALVGVAERPIEVERRLDVKIDALTALVSQLATRQGTPIDMDAVEAVVQRGVQEAISSIDTTVTVKPA